MKNINYVRRKVSAAALAFSFAAVATVTPWLGLAGKAFAVAPTAPTNVRVMTGGNSIAVLWEPASGSAAATSYKIYRGGTLKATVSPVNNNLSQGTTQRWLDTSVVNGTSYSYQVSAVNADGESVKSLTATITHSTTVPVPTVTIDPSTPASLTTFANNVKATLQAWYPKFVNYLGNPSGTSSSITLQPVSGLANTAQQVGNTIQYNQEWAIANATVPTAPNLFLHEATHVLQMSGQPTVYMPWAHEGMATYMENYVFGDNNAQTISLTGTNETWLRGYEYSAYFFNWMSKTFNKPNLVKDFDASFNPSYDMAFFSNQSNGKSLGQLWWQMGGRRVSSATRLYNINATLCMEMTGQFFNPPAFAPPELAACNSGSPIQQFEYIPDDATGTNTDLAVNTQGEIRVLTLPMTGTCLDVYGSGTTAGTPVYTYGCNGSVAQKWQILGNGSLKNPNSGMCLQPVGKATAAGTGMEIAACDASSAQNWFVRPLGVLKNQTGFACASTSGTVVQVYSCSAGIPQQSFQYVQPTPGASSGQIKNPLAVTCLQPVGGSTAVDSQMEFAACTSATTQQWQWQADMKVKNIGSGLCLTLPVFGTTPLTQTSCTTDLSPASLKKWDTLYNY